MGQNLRNRLGRIGRWVAWLSMAVGVAYLPADLLGAADWVTDQGWIDTLPSSTWLSPVLVFSGVGLFYLLVRADRRHQKASLAEERGSQPQTEPREREKESSVTPPPTLRDLERWITHQANPPGWEGDLMQVPHLGGIPDLRRVLAVGLAQKDDQAPLLEAYVVVRHLLTSSTFHPGPAFGEARSNVFVASIPEDFPELFQRWPLWKGDYLVTWVNAETNEEICQYGFSVTETGRVLPDESALHPFESPE